MDLIFPVLAILIFSLFFTKQFKLASAASPIFSISLITVFLCLMGMINLLVIGVYVIYILALFCLYYLFIQKKYSVLETLKEFASPGIVFFIAGVLFFFFLLRSKHAIFRDWDEFSFWGTAAKTVFYYDKLYTFIPVSKPLSYAPALPVFGYFTQFFSRTFYEFRTYVAYDIMIVAALTTMFSRVKWRNVVAIISITAFSFLGIYAFFHASEGLRAYATSYSDMQIGFLFGGSLLLWFSDDEKRPVRYFAALSLLLVITLCKDIGLAVSFVAALIMIVDMYLSGNYISDSITDKKEITKLLAIPILILVLAIPIFLFFNIIYGIIAVIFAIAIFILLKYLKNPATKWLSEKEKFFFRVTFMVFLFVAITLVYRFWAIHYQALRNTSRDETFHYSILDVIQGKSEVFNLVYEEMMYRFTHHSIICFGTVIEMVAVFTIVPIVISIVTWKKKNILRVSALSILLALGFFVYYMFHAYLFSMLFAQEYIYEHTGSIELASYNRYISTYAIGWMFAIVGVLYFEVAKPIFKPKILTFISSIAVSFAFVFSILYFTPDHLDQYLITSEKVIVSECAARQIVRKHLGRVISEIKEGDKLYFVSFSTDGGEEFIILYEAFPAVTVEELGIFIDPSSDVVGLREYKMDRKGFSDFLKENEINLVYVNYGADEYFFNEFGPLFEDGLSYTYDDSTRIYYVVDEGNEEVNLVPVLNSEQLKQLKNQNQ